MDSGSNSTQNQGYGSYNNTANGTGGGSNGYYAGGGNNGNDAGGGSNGYYAGGGNNGNDGGGGNNGNNSGNEGGDDGDGGDGGNENQDELLNLNNEIAIDRLTNFTARLSFLINDPNLRTHNSLFSTINTVLNYISTNLTDGHYLPSLMSMSEARQIRTALDNILIELVRVLAFIDNIQVRRNPIHDLIAESLSDLRIKIVDILGRLRRYNVPN
jgi:hypothetical protein